NGGGAISCDGPRQHTIEPCMEALGPPPQFALRFVIVQHRTGESRDRASGSVDIVPPRSAASDRRACIEQDANGFGDVDVAPLGASGEVDARVWRAFFRGCEDAGREIAYG